MTAELRRWLRIPDGRPLPSWVAPRLSERLVDERRARQGTPLQSAVFGVVDLETTGTSTDRHRILEIGLVVLRGGRVLGRFTTLVDVPAPVPRDILELTGIDPRELEGAPGEEAALRGLATALRETGVQALVAHNAPFDRRFLERAWQRHAPGGELPPFLCSLWLARRWVRAPKHGLDALVSQLGIPRHVRHRALGDAEMTAALWIELLGRARLRGVHTLESLLAQGSPRRRNRSPRSRSGA